MNSYSTHRLTHVGFDLFTGFVHTKKRQRITPTWSFKCANLRGIICEDMQFSWLELIAALFCSLVSLAVMRAIVALMKAALFSDCQYLSVTWKPGNYLFDAPHSRCQSHRWRRWLSSNQGRRGGTTSRARKSHRLEKREGGRGRIYLSGSAG